MHVRTIAAASLLTACLPEVSSDLSRVDEPRILAVRAEPAEVAPGEVSTFTALYADASGEIDMASLDWALCNARRPLAELGPVNRLCLEKTNKSLVSLGEGPSVSGGPPDDACRRFGPEPPLAQPGQPTGRVVDPDLTGGYYQPLRILPADAGAELSLLQLRLRCGLAGATQQQAAEYRKRYKPNVAPAVLELTADGATVAAPRMVAAGTAVALRVAWPACPEQASCGDGLCSLDESLENCPGDCSEINGCGGAERYLRFDPISLTLLESREAIGVAWFATDGTFEKARTGRAADEPETTSDNVWTAPDGPGPVTLWVVLRDDRGAASWRRVDIEVTA